MLLRYNPIVVLVTSVLEATMTPMIVRAVYRGGVLKPVTQLNLPEGATVEMRVTSTSPTPSAKPSAFGKLAGIWKHLTQPELAQLEQGLTEIRRQAAENIEHLAQELK